MTSGQLPAPSRWAVDVGSRVMSGVFCHQGAEADRGELASSAPGNFFEDTAPDEVE